MAAMLAAQVQEALPKERATVSVDEVNNTLTALSWFTTDSGHYEQKGSFQRTMERDMTEQSLGLKLMLENLPVMMQETAWYPAAYPETEMRKCPMAHSPPESVPIELQGHFLMCEVTKWLPAPALPPRRPMAN
ncbi:hypothetical protein FB639_001742 [Coemansia asiatica]|nr:hypothetical protein FB639_001742 [Coemansia asiatica]